MSKASRREVENNIYSFEYRIGVVLDTGTLLERLERNVTLKRCR